MLAAPVLGNNPLNAPLGKCGDGERRVNDPAIHDVVAFDSAVKVASLSEHATTKRVQGSPVYHIDPVRARSCDQVPSERLTALLSFDSITEFR